MVMYLDLKVDLVLLVVYDFRLMIRKFLVVVQVFVVEMRYFRKLIGLGPEWWVRRLNVLKLVKKVHLEIDGFMRFPLLLELERMDYPGFVGLVRYEVVLHQIQMCLDVDQSRCLLVSMILMVV